VNVFSRSAALLVPLVVGFHLAGCGCTENLEEWPLWLSYSNTFIEKDGRVVDHTASDRTTSEAQAYAMFHALVTDDRERFRRILAWTETNLAQGDLSSHLPAWNWGRNESGNWGVLDANSASDADLFLAYNLIEAGRLWCNPQYGELGRRIAARIVDTEIVNLPGLGPMMLPGPVGFQVSDDLWRLNPSYLALPLLRRMASSKTPGPWGELAVNAVRLLQHSTSPAGFVADWVGYDREQGFVSDSVHGNLGSYDAIRAYLWVAILSDADPDKSALLHRMQGMYRMWRDHGILPEKNQGIAPPRETRAGPAGFYAALLPMAREMGDQDTFARLRRMVQAHRLGELYGAPGTYYDQNLIMFAEGFVDRRYRFAADGTLEPRWDRPCRLP